MTAGPLTDKERAARRRAKTQPIFARTEREDVIAALDRLAERAGGSKRRALEDAILAADAADRAD